MNKKKKILLVYPETPVTYWSYKYVFRFTREKATTPPLGLLTVAAMLPEEEFEVKLVDMNISNLSDRMIEWADMVFLSAMLVQKDSFSAVAKRCKQLGTSVVAGGPYASSFYTEIENVDHFVLDEAEITLPLFLEDYKRGKVKHIYKADGEKPDIKTSPLPRFDLLNMKRYNSMAIQFSRGCPYDCEFCDIIEMFGRRMRTKSEEQIIREMEELYSLGWRGPIFFVDDNFIGHRRRTKKLLRRVLKWQREKKYPFSLFTEASVDLADDEELLELFRQCGFTMVFVGIETPSEESLLNAGKKQNLKNDLLESISKIQSKGIEVTAGFIVGFDSDTPDIFQRQIDFIKESSIPVAMVGLLTALPNTRLYRRLQQEGRILSGSTGNNTHELTLTFKPIMPMHVIIDGYKHIISHIYSPRVYFNRCLTLFKKINFIKRVTSMNIEINQLVSLLKSLFIQTFSWYGHHYLAYVLKTIFTSIRAFPDAIRLAVVGHHFFKITREIIAVDDFKTRTFKLISAYSKRMSDAYESINLGKNLEQLYKIKNNFIKSMQKKYYKIDEDFRHLVDEHLESLQRHLNRGYSRLLNLHTKQYG
ncbi:MAG: B12-binding domain-containing radical SAM protein [Spirochaetes bacterium]|nr:MAG: B12-binding domain-containing radical SAM protein [Spirochaetota bacterium]